MNISVTQVKACSLPGLLSYLRQNLSLLTTYFCRPCCNGRVKPRPNRKLL